MGASLSSGREGTPTACVLNRKPGSHMTLTETIPSSADTGRSPLRVLIAGGGVAALEALLALRELAGDRVAINMLAPDPKFRYRPLSVTEPFGLGVARDLDLLEIVLEHDATFLKDAVAAVDVAGRTIATTAGRILGYDVLLLATGARGVEGLPGALTFRDSADLGAMRDLVADLERGRLRRLAFAVPGDLAWPLGLYELALLCSSRARELALEEIELTLVTREARPMEIFGPQAGEVVGRLLEQAGIAMRLASRPITFADGELAIENQPALACDRVVSLPIPEGPTISGVPQERGGFIAVDRFGAVFGAERVYAAGDATWFPVKQGGIATQMADSAASSIAALAGAPVDPQPFQPVLRGAVLTQWGPRYLRRAFTESRGEAARSVLWWPPSKIAGKYLAPYLAKRAGYRIQAGCLDDLQAPAGEDAAAVDGVHEDVVAIALSSANLNANDRDFSGALRWLEVVEDLQLYLPPGYESKRASWLELAAGGW
jgi:sulfide:quinone oxidoreductase